jgi:hypothetical protein
MLLVNLTVQVFVILPIDWNAYPRFQGSGAGAADARGGNGSVQSAGG